MTQPNTTATQGVQEYQQTVPPQGYQQTVPPQGYQQQYQYAPPAQQGGYAAPMPNQQYGYPPMQPLVPPQMGKKESFVGINLLSKIGVIFIIIGVIAFSAVSEDFLSPLIRTIIIFALGAAMTALGEVFYRTSSVAFARALTIGGIGELSISVLIGYHNYETLNDITALIITVLLAAGIILLSVRYKSQPILACTVFFGFLPCFATLETAGVMFATAFYLLLFQSAAIIVCEKNKWHIAPFFIEVSNFAISIGIYFSLCDIMSDNVSASLLAVAYVIISTLVPIAGMVIGSFRNSGALSGRSIASFITSASIQMLLSAIFIFVTDLEMNYAFGFVALFIACAYFAIAAVAKTYIGKCPLATTLIISGIISIGFAIPSLFRSGMIGVAFHVYATVLFLTGSISKNRMMKICGIITCCIAEYIFARISIYFIEEKIFMLLFGANALLWLVIMIVLAARKTRSAIFSMYSIFSLINAVMYLLYLLNRILEALKDDNILESFGEGIACFMLFSALVWMIAAFIVGKLRFLGKAAPAASIVFYIFALSGLGITNIVSSISSPADNMLCLTASIAANLISVLAVLDITLSIKALKPNFSKAVGLIVSLYAVLCVTFTLSANDIVAFSNCIISIIYLALAIVWIVWGFAKRNAAMRRFGLALTLLASAKLFLLDFSGIGAVAKTLMFILFGIVLLTVSFIYAIFEKKLKKQEQEELYQQQLQYYNYYNSVNNNNYPPQQ